MSLWRQALGEAERDEREAERKLAELKDQRAKFLKQWNIEREAAKQELRDAIKAKKSAAYALKTGREPK